MRTESYGDRYARLFYRLLVAARRHSVARAVCLGAAWSRWQVRVMDR